MTSPTDAELDEMQARCDAATEGPWDINNDLGTDEIYCDWHSVGPIALVGQFADANSIFIAHARTDIPRLIAEVRRLRRARHGS